MFYIYNVVSLPLYHFFYILCFGIFYIPYLFYTNIKTIINLAINFQNVPFNEDIHYGESNNKIVNQAFDLMEKYIKDLKK